MSDQHYSAASAALHGKIEADRKILLENDRRVMGAWKARHAAADEAAREARKVEREALRVAKARSVELSDMEKRVEAEVGSEATGEERRRARKMLNKRDSRSKRDEAVRKAKSANAAPAGPPRVPDFAKVRSRWEAEKRALQGWLRQPGRRQDQLRSRAAELITVRYIWLRECERRGENPTHTEFSTLLATAAQRTSALGEGPFTRHDARAKLRTMEILAGPGGPWGQFL